MKLHLLEDLIHRFIQYQLQSAETSWYFPHSIVDNFHVHWNSSSALSLKERYENSLKSEISQRWWKRENYRPKEIMLKLIQADEELASIAFKDLANDSPSLDGRLSRFNFYCEELLQMHRKKHIRDIETHHHQDAGIISLYLAGWFPEKYPLYPGFESFQKFSMAIGSPEIPVIDDLVRYYKMTAIIYKFLIRDPQFQMLEEKRMHSNERIKFIPFQVTYEIFRFAADQKNSSA